MIVLLGFAGCDRSLDRPLHFEVPVGYAGPLLLIEHPDHPKILRTTQKEYRIVVPDSGVVRLSDAWVLHSWHTTKASYSDGASINTGSGQSGFGFHHGPTSTSDNRTYHNWFFVGEHSAAEEFFNGRDSTTRVREWLDQHGVK